MERVPMNKNTKQMWVIMGVIIVIVLIVGCVTGLAIKRKPVQNAEQNRRKQAVLSVVYSIEREKEFIEFEKLFREQEDDLKKLAEELVNQNLFENQNYIIFFDEHSYFKDFLKLFYIDGTFISGVNEELVGKLKSRDFFTDEQIEKILSSDDDYMDVNKELVEILNENTALKEVLNSIIENGAIISISAYTSGDMWILEFTVDPKFTPFITLNYGFANAFQYCEDEGLEDIYNIYNHKKVEDNWYLWISPVPDK